MEKFALALNCAIAVCLLQSAFVVALICYECENQRTDNSCNSGRTRNCTKISEASGTSMTRCKTTTKIGRFVSKGCAAATDCASATPPIGEILTSCCSASLCNQNTTWPTTDALAENKLRASIGTQPAQFLAQLVAYQILSTLVYAAAVIYILKTIPWKKRVSPPTANRKAHGVKEDIIEME